MTTRKRKGPIPMLRLEVELSEQMAGADQSPQLRAARDELRAAEAVIRAARRNLRAYDGESSDEQWDSAEAMRRSLARLDKLTRPTRRTP